MLTDRKLVKEIEGLRSEMYHAQEREDHYDEILRISQKLDEALNKLEVIEEKLES